MSLANDLRYLAKHDDIRRRRALRLLGRAIVAEALRDDNAEPPRRPRVTLDEVNARRCGR